MKTSRNKTKLGLQINSFSWKAINKKAIIITLTLLLTSSIILSLGITYKKIDEGNSERFSNIVISDRLYDISQSISENLGEIIRLEKQINISKYNYSIRIQELLGNTTSNNFKSNLQSYTNFIYSNGFTGIINETLLLTNLSLNITPQNIIYMHNKSLNNSIFISVGSANYTLNLQTDRDIETCNTDTTAGNMSFIFVMTDINGTECSTTLNLNNSLENTITIVNSSLHHLYNITLNQQGLEIVKYYDELLNVDLEIGLNIPPVNVFIPKIIEIKYTDFNISTLKPISLLYN